MLVHTDNDYAAVKDAEGELRQQFGQLPDQTFYTGKLQAAWERARGGAYYADLGPFSLAAFEQLPPTPKASLKARPLDFCTVSLGQAAKYYATTGTTGEPTPTPRLKQDIIWNAISVASHWQSVLQRGARVANLMPSDIVPVGDLIANVCEYLDVSHVRLYPFTTGITDWERVCTTFATYQPTVLFIAPGVLVQLTRYLKQREMLDGFAQSVRSIMLLGEVNTLPFRERLARWWQCEVFDASYGSTETGTLAAVGEDRVMRLATATNYFELLLADGRLVPPARALTGRLVVTPLNLYARPLLRLDTGDSVTITSECTPGLLSPTLLVNGRDHDSIVVSGVPLEIRAVEEVVYGNCDATGYMIEVDRDNDTAALILERDVVWDSSQEAALQARLQAHSEAHMRLRWSRILFVNNLSALNKSGASQKSWKKTNLRFVGGQP
ncbi:phenylacetate--CoA ligase family protein [Pseudomonas sp. BP8]|uniref:phenylacetate--CoA ligase family protein n=1 Tax=Pseudomonas sp. BP8 TaxID=2817864 RepID=UPI001AEB95BF|nr:phenylacetate--CoA ligase family protein [Pseudomonas sp. BP8]MBP2262499.1 phenylacetate-CoA ligase [Pseudomonas sp. BP8]HDS1733694.1 phenylacetate--CoA ligase family protein [Pseudomonas putida]